MPPNTPPPVVNALFATNVPPVSVPIVNAPVLVNRPLLSEPVSVRLPEFVAVAEAKSVAVAVAPEPMLNVPPLTELNDVVPAFNANAPETTFTMLLLPVPFSVNEPPSSEPLKVATPPTLTAPWVNAFVSAKLCAILVVPAPYRLPILTVPLLDPKLNSAPLLTVAKEPAAAEYAPELNVALPDEMLNVFAPPKSVLTFRVPPVTFTAPVKPDNVPPRFNTPLEFIVPAPDNAPVNVPLLAVSEPALAT